MSFPFPKNPTDGQVVSQTAPDGSILTATYRAVKNEWELTRQAAPSSAISSGAPPSPVVVSATADGQVITWDQVAGKWLAKTPKAASGGSGGTFIKANQAAADTSNPPDPANPTQTLKPGMLQTTPENLHHELKYWTGAAWAELFSEDTIKAWISAGSLFRGVVKESSLSTLPAPATSNRGYYFSWTGAPGHVVSAADPLIGTDLAGEVLQVGDWIQSDGTKWVHVPGDLLSKQRWDSLGSFVPWSDTSWEKGALVSYQQGFWRANALISPGDDAPENVPGNKWTDITPHPSIKLAELADVNDNVALQGEDGVLLWSEVDGEFVVSRTLQVDAIEFDATGPGIAIEGLFQGDISLGKNLDSQVPSVEAVARYVDSRSLEDLAGSTDLNTAQDGEFIAYDAANNKWVPKAASSSIAGLTDVDLTTAQTDGQVLAWNLATLRWKPVSPVTKVSELKDVLIVNEPTDGMSLIYSARSHKWRAGSPHANMPEWSRSVTYQPGDVVHFEGRIWRAMTGVAANSNTNKKPEIANGSALAFWKDAAGGSHGPAPIEFMTTGDPTVAPTTPPAIQVGTHVWLIYRSDTDYSLWSWELDTATRNYSWKKAANTFLPAWRHVALPSPVTTADTGQVWLFGLPGSTTAPAIPQPFWEPLALGDFLVSLADVNVASATNGQVLTFDGTSNKWIPTNYVSGYTKTEVDNKFTNLVSGIEHEESVLSKVNAPPSSPNQYDLYIVGTVPTGAWVGHANELAEWDGAAWKFAAARTNEAHLVEDETATYSWNGTAWVKVAVAATGGSSAQAGVGEIVAWIGDNFPATDYLECTGQIVAVGTYPDLHGVIGNKYNPGTAADGTSTFALPDLRGYFLRGSKAGLGVGAKQQWTTGRPRNPFTTDNPGNHSHGFSDGDQPVCTSIGGHDLSPAGGGNQEGYRIFHPDGGHTHTITGGGDTETAPDHFAVKWLIRYKPVNGGATGARGPQGLAGTNGTSRVAGRVDFGPNGHQRYWDSQQNQWLYVFAPYVNMDVMVPVGNIAQIRMSVNARYIHGSSIKLRGGFQEGNALPGMTVSNPAIPGGVKNWVSSSPVETDNGTATLEHSFTTTVTAGLQYVIWLQVNMHGSNNMDSYYYGGFEVLDLGPATAPAALPVDWTLATPA